MTENLLPCPFCGGPARIGPDEFGSGGQWVYPLHVGCKACALDMLCGDAESPREAIAAWNRRAAPEGDQTPLELEGLIERLNKAAARVRWEQDEGAANFQVPNRDKAVLLEAAQALTAQQAEVDRLKAQLHTLQGSGI